MSDPDPEWLKRRHQAFIRMAERSRRESQAAIDRMRAEAAKPRKPILPADFRLSTARWRAGTLEGILAERRFVEVWERHYRGEATSLEVLDAGMAAYVPDSTAARVAHVREFEDKARRYNDTHALRTIALWRLRRQLAEQG